jgi:hypothetical protein
MAEWQRGPGKWRRSRAGGRTLLLFSRACSNGGSTLFPSDLNLRCVARVPSMSVLLNGLISGIIGDAASCASTLLPPPPHTHTHPPFRNVRHHEPESALVSVSAFAMRLANYTSILLGFRAPTRPNSLAGPIIGILRIILEISLEGYICRLFRPPPENLESKSNKPRIADARKYYLLSSFLF